MLELRLFYALVFFFKQKTAYEMRISDWSSDVCSSDLTDCAATDIPSPTSSSAKAWRNPSCVPLITPESYPNMKPPIVATATISAIRPLLTRSSVPSVIPVSPCRPILVDRMNRHVSASSALRELFLAGRPSYASVRHRRDAAPRRSAAPPNRGSRIRNPTTPPPPPPP